MVDVISSSDARIEALDVARAMDPPLIVEGFDIETRG